jgi:predicted amidohydrolase YtcJ
MAFQLVNARLFGKPKEELFNVTISDGLVSAIYPVGFVDSAIEIIDVDGAWVAPSFTDAHVHTTNSGVRLIGLDLSGCDSYESLSFEISKLPQSESVLIGHGWDDSHWSKPADINVFDKSSPAIYLSRIDAHSALASPRLIQAIPDLAEIDGFHPTNPITRDAHGVTREYAYSKLSKADRTRYIEVAIEEFLANGIGEIHEMAGPRISSRLDAAEVMSASRELGINVELWWGELDGHETAAELNSKGCGGDLFIDGSFGSRTAFVKSAYLDGTFGKQYISVDQATRHIIRGYDYGLPTSFHVIGDAAIEIATIAFEGAKQELGSLKFNTLTHRLEHVEFLTPEITQRIIDLNVVFSMQPQFSSEWAGDAGMYNERIGSDWKSLNPLRPILNQGGRMIFGSDSPVTEINAWKTINSAMNMHNPEYSITQKSAFRAHTVNAERTTETFGIGSPANIAVWEVEQWAQTPTNEINNRWSTDVRSFPTDFPNSATPPKCLMTISKGNIVFSKLGDLHV